MYQWHPFTYIARTFLQPKRGKRNLESQGQPSRRRSLGTADTRQHSSTERYSNDAYPSKGNLPQGLNGVFSNPSLCRRPHDHRGLHVVLKFSITYPTTFRNPASAPRGIRSSAKGSSPWRQRREEVPVAGRSQHPQRLVCCINSVHCCLPGENVGVYLSACAATLFC